jgi:hypothetical protein
MVVGETDAAVTSRRTSRHSLGHKVQDRTTGCHINGQ